MVVLISDWGEYELLDSGNGLRLERFGDYILVRPDPQAIWKPKQNRANWEKVDAVFEAAVGKGEKGRWVKKTNIPDRWQIHYDNLTFWIELTNFKHTGIFPEQSAHWNWLQELIPKDRQINILNLFAYTGAASLVCANAGAKVTHVDASKPTIGWARKNQSASRLDNKPIRWLPDDAIKFVRREIKRGVRYDGIIMDPPVYGHGPEGERWDFQKDFPLLWELCRQVLSVKPLFVIVNAYAISASAYMLDNILQDLELPGVIESGELALKELNTERILSTGIFARWKII